MRLPYRHRLITLRFLLLIQGFICLPDGVGFEVIERVLYISVADVGRGGFTADAYGNLRVVDSSR